MFIQSGFVTPGCKWRDSQPWRHVKRTSVRVRPTYDGSRPTTPGSRFRSRTWTSGVQRPLASPRLAEAESQTRRHGLTASQDDTPGCHPAHELVPGAILVCIGHHLLLYPVYSGANSRSLG